MIFTLTITLLIGLTFALFMIKRPNKREQWLAEIEQHSFEGVLEYVKLALKELCQIKPSAMSSTYEQDIRQCKRRAELLQALKRCVYGSKKDKAYVLDVIFDILCSGSLNVETLITIIPYDFPFRLSALDMFDGLLYKYQLQFGDQGFSRLVDRYSLDRPKTYGDVSDAYVITDKEIQEIFALESPIFSREEKLRILAQRLYQRYKGFSVIDTLRDMAIDGVSGGVSGLTEMAGMDRVGASELGKLPMSYDSVWVFYKGKSIHLAFMSFGTQDELKRVCQNIYRYNNTGMLSQDVGYKINDMMDGSRVVVVRPDFSESWAFFVRKFHLEHVSLEALITDQAAELPIKMMRYLVKGGRITAITGSQGSGKTTLLMALVGEIYSALTLRVQETAFELHLRKLYPNRNILTFKETHHLNGQQGLDLQKKTDGSVNILGEIATDEVAAWMIQMAQVASLFTIFTHHAKTVSDLVLALRNSLLKCDVFRNEVVAQEQVVNVLHFDVHLVRDYTGKRYIERITEIVPVENDFAYPDAYRSADSKDASRLFMDTMKTYFERMTDRKIYEARDIIRYNQGRYEVCHPITEKQIVGMGGMMTHSDAEEFHDFIEANWMGGIADVSSDQVSSIS